MPSSQAAADARAELEKAIRAAFDSNELAEAATIAIRGYGPEVLGFLHALARNEADASEAFATFSEDLWRGLPAFGWKSSFRTWAYTIARNALFRSHRDPLKKGAMVGLADCREVAELANRVRTTTLVHLRTEVKDRVARIREQLDADEQALLILRVDRNLSWKEIAQIMDDDQAGSGDALKKSASRLRKRFERTKERLRELVHEDAAEQP